MKIEFPPSIPAFQIDLRGDGYGHQFWEKLGRGFYEPDTIGIINRFAGVNSLFIDCGAATGAMTLIAASLGFRVIAVEANREVFECLARNVELNPDIRVRIDLRNVIIAPCSEMVQLPAQKISNRILTEITYSGVGKDAFSNVPFVTLKDLLPAVNSSSTLIKIDLEGAEWALFSCQEFISLLELKKAIVLVALHPGLNRPWKKAPKNRKLWNYLKKLLWWRRNILEIIKFFESIRNFEIERTNGSSVTSKWKFIALVTGGCHEFLLLPKK